MALLKCKMCGGDLEISEGASVAECEYCGTKQTVPKSTDENLQGFFNRANTLRIKSEFDKAEKLYEKIIQVDPTQAEAYWGLILCKYGIDYVDDPLTLKKVPTCHRVSFDSIVADDDYKSALEHADLLQRAIYEEQAKEIDRIQKEILALAQKEESYDVFICYKETDSNGMRTQDSVIANDIYYQLTQEGFKVFYAAITLEGKLGSAYEPIIFAALNSAKVMLVIGTKPEYFNAVWVKNEWSRFLKIIKKDRSKLLIPCYRDMDAYELPDEFAHLQAQDMSKIGFINDVVRGIKKIIKRDEPKAAVVRETVVTSSAVNVAPLLKRAFMFLEDGEFDRADEFCEQALNQDPENVQAYLGKLLAELHVSKKEKLINCPKPFDTGSNYKKLLRFADDKLKAELLGYIEHINTRNRNEQLEANYQSAVRIMKSAVESSQYDTAAVYFEQLGNYKDAQSLGAHCRNMSLTMRYDIAVRLMNTASTPNAFKTAAEHFEKIGNFKDAKDKAKECLEKAEQARLKAAEEKKRRQQEEEQRKKEEEQRRQREEERKADEAYQKMLERQAEAKKRSQRKKIVRLTVIVIIIVAIIGVVCFLASPSTTLKYTLNADGSSYSVSGSGFFTVGDKVIPSTYNGLPVTNIADNAFENTLFLKSVTIPKSITSIGEDAFGSTAIKDVYYTGDIESWCEIVFATENSNPLCRNPSLYFDGKLVTNIVIPDNVARINDYAFYHYDSLASVTFGKNSQLTSIGNNAFCDCDHLTSINIPDSVTSIGDSAFYDCGSLLSINIPNSVTSIGDCTFRYCTSLSSATIGDSVTSIGEQAFIGCPLTSITIPSSVTKIGMWAFSNCSSLKSITFDNPQGWWKDNKAYSESRVDSSSLKDPATAAKLLTTTYTDYWWTRK